MGLQPLPGAKLPSPESFQGKKAYVYGAHAMSIRLKDSQGTERETKGTFYAVDFPTPDVILGRPWRRDQSIVSDAATNQWRYGFDVSKAELVTRDAFEKLTKRGTLRTSVRICVGFFFF